MLELVTTRHNPMIDPALHVWGYFKQDHTGGVSGDIPGNTPLPLATHEHDSKKDLDVIFLWR